MEKRNFTRVAYTECASFKYEDQLFVGDVQDISLQGMYIKSDKELPLHAAVEVTVYHPLHSSFHLFARVVRHAKEGLALRVQGIDVRSFTILRDFVAMQSKNHNLILRETYKIVGCIH